MNKHLPALAALLLSTAAWAAAQEASSPPPPAAQSTQIDGADGPVTVRWGQSETVPNAADYRAKVADLDQNGDGLLTRSEVPATHALSSEFSLVDRNRDGRITAAELAGWR